MAAWPGREPVGLAEREHRLFVVHSLDMSYRKTARLDDLITIRSRITNRPGFDTLRAARRAQWELLAQGNIQICCVDSIRMRPAELPDDIRAKLKFIQIQE